MRRNLSLTSVLSLALFAVVGAAHGEDGYYTDAQSGCRIWARNISAAITAHWKGGCRNGLAEGQGVLTLSGPVESRFEGQWAAGRQTGLGLIVVSTGMRYEGEIRDGLQNGKGLIVWPGRFRYKGSFANGAYHGYGEVEFDKACNGCDTPGARYAGDWEYMKPQGKGKMTLQSGVQYEGEWGNALPNGDGTYSWDNGAKRYVGKWASGCSLSPQGQLYSFPDPDVHSCDVMLDYLRRYTR